MIFLEKINIKPIYQRLLTGVLFNSLSKSMKEGIEKFSVKIRDRLRSLVSNCFKCPIIIQDKIDDRDNQCCHYLSY
jgi:hypothetical protein